MSDASTAAQAMPTSYGMQVPASWGVRGLDEATATRLYDKAAAVVQPAQPPPENEQPFVRDYLAAADEEGFAILAGRSFEPSDSIWVRSTAVFMQALLKLGALMLQVEPSGTLASACAILTKARVHTGAHAMTTPGSTSLLLRP